MHWYVKTYEKPLQRNPLGCWAFLGVLESFTSVVVVLATGRQRLWQQCACLQYSRSLGLGNGIGDIPILLAYCCFLLFTDEYEVRMDLSWNPMFATQDWIHFVIVYWLCSCPSFCWLVGPGESETWQTISVTSVDIGKSVSWRTRRYV